MDGEQLKGKQLKRGEVNPTGPHNTTFILLHDRGSSGAELQHKLCDAILPSHVSQIVPGARFVFPDGPRKGPNGGRDWYALEHPLKECEEEASLDQWRHVMYAAEQVDMVVEDEAQHVGRENVFIGGVGKGCAVAMITLLEKEHALGGFVGFGGWMPFVRNIMDLATLGMIQTPGPPFSKNGRYSQGGNGEPSSGQSNGSAMDWEPDPNQSIDPRLFADQDEQQQQQQQQQQQAAPRPVFPLPDQSTKARHERVAYFLRQPEWKESSRSKYAVDLSTATPIVLVHSTDDDEVNYSHAKEAQMMLMQLGFNVKLKASKSRHKITSEVLSDSMLGLVETLSNGDLRVELMQFFQGAVM
ncbi:hypothetical protein ACHAPT_007418 [Fusarium lateritium]